MSGTILTVDDSASIRMMVSFTLKEKGYRVIEATDGIDGIAKLRTEPVDMVITDLNMPKMDGIECVRQVKALVPSALILMLTVYEDSERIFNSLLAGASGYLLKRTPRAGILEAIADVYRGNSPMTGHIARKVVQYFNQRGRNHQEIGRLSQREREVLRLMAAGLSNREIADRLLFMKPGEHTFRLHWLLVDGEWQIENQRIEHIPPVLPQRRRLHHRNCIIQCGMFLPPGMDRSWPGQSKHILGQLI